ncbi:glutathione S-transferase 1-like [Pollicipes pollicipes]|uniref:glutathione S-transferase 1-like n=1 Tax=Pollicipes pollicipes TaxID=41117 RepID=UPI00188595FC|nr:glutathione S-transferase 1-like [Pollicipes pollicipes]
MSRDHANTDPSNGTKMKLYWDPVPPPCQAVLLTASYLNMETELQLVRVDVMKNEQMTGSFLGVNPLHQLPVLVEPDGFILTESRAIMTYLAERAGPRGLALYPPEPRARASCHRWLLFDLTCLWQRLKGYHLPVVERRAGRPAAAALPAIHEALADLGLATSVAQARALLVDLRPYAAVRAWYAAVQARAPALAQAEHGSEQYAAILRQLTTDWELTQAREGSGEEEARGRAVSPAE